MKQGRVRMDHGGAVRGPGSAPGFLYRLPASVKLVAVMAGVIATVLLPRNSWTLFGAMGAGLILLALASRVPTRTLGRRLLLVEPFAISMAILSLFQPQGGVVFFAILTKSTLCLAMMVLLNLTTRFSDLLNVLLRWRLPRLLVTTLALTYRYLFVLTDESARLFRARRSRTFVGGRWSAWRGASTIAAQLFIRSSERAERVHSAMCARGWW